MTNIYWLQGEILHQGGIFVDECVVEHFGVIGVDRDIHAPCNILPHRMGGHARYYASADIGDRIAFEWDLAFDEIVE